MIRNTRGLAGFMLPFLALLPTEYRVPLEMALLMLFAISG